MLIKIVKILWMILSVLVLLISLYSYDGSQNSDIGIFYSWSMLILSFPAGLIVSALYVVMYDVFSIVIQTSYLSIIIDWSLFFILGYLQWFVLIPALIKKYKSKNK